jgi:serine/threonine-protein kinase
VSTVAYSSSQGDASSPGHSSSRGDSYCPSCEKKFAGGDRCPADNTRLVKLSAAVDPFIGRELDGRYMILEKLGNGGMGMVYRASQLSVGRDCAIKVISPSHVTNETAIKRFLREAKLASRLSHPNAVAVLDFGQTSDGVFYLAMELVEGRTLEQVFKDENVFEPHRLVRIGSQVCDALEGAHALQIVHRDLKPSNIMLLSRGRDLVKVLDFGLAKSLAPDQSEMTATDDLIGTPAFIPPELALGQPYDGRADLYSLGCVLYQLGSGSLPFRSSSKQELVQMHGILKAPPMTGAPAALAQVIDRMLQREPAARYQSASECREALEAAVEGRLYTPPTGLPQLASGVVGALMSAEIRKVVTGPTMTDSLPVPRSPALRRPAWVIAAIVAGLLVVGGGVFALTRHDTPDTVSSTSPAAVIAPPTPVAPAAAVVTPPPAAVTSLPVTPPPPEPPKVRPAMKSQKSKPAPAKLKPSATPRTTSGLPIDDDPF